MTHMSPLKNLLSALACLLPFQAAAQDEDLARVFARQGADGTLVIASLKTGRSYVHNDARAARRFAPASTFKIPNTLIALEQGAVATAGEVFHWDGTAYDFPDWNRDQSLASAFKVSCVWCYQALAQRLGPQTYQDYLGRWHYGKLSQAFGLTTFWLDGSLQISALEQIAFLKKLHRRTLGLRPASYETLSGIMLAERKPGYALWAKTGWAARMAPQVGWYVGYVETQADTWVFALNLDIHGKDELALRPKLAEEGLRAKGIIE